MVLNFGLMVQDMKVSGEMIKPMDKANWYMQMVTFMKASGLMIRLKVKELTVMQMVHIMKAHGLMINNMDSVSRAGPMALDMKASMWKARKKATGDLLSLMVVTTKVNSDKTKSAGLEIIFGLMVNLIQEIGRRTKWMVPVC